MPRGRRIACAIGYAALLVASAWLLHLVAQRALSLHLSARAAHALALAARGETPYHWRFRQADDVVAGRVFGASARFEHGALSAQAGAQPFEIGLPLARPVDLSLFPHLDIVAGVDVPAQLAVLERATLLAPQRELAHATLAPGQSSLRLELAPAAASDAAEPLQAAMLRLRVTLPPGQEFRLRAAALERVRPERLDLARPVVVADAGAAPPDDATIVYRLPLRGDLQAADLAAIRRATPAERAPLVLLPQRGRVEQQVALRNAVFAALPGAILIPADALEPTFAAARAEAGGAAPAPASNTLRWLLALGLAAAMLAARLRPPRHARLRALIEVALALAAPLWLVLFEPFEGHLSSLQWTLIALSVAFAASLTPRRWHWNGSARAWLLALAVVGFATALGLALHADAGEPHALSAGHVSRYLLWALAQQYLICAVCTERWFVLSGNRALAVYLGALGFALLHTPNAALMLATFTGGLFWCALYLRERALLPLALSHAACALALLALLPRSLLLSAEVSARFFQ